MLKDDSKELKQSSEKTRSLILRTAVRLFGEKGWGNVNIEDIVKEVGVTRGAFYHYFKSREELVYAAIVEMFLENNPFDMAAKKKGLNGLEKLRLAIKNNLKQQSDPVLIKDLERAFNDPVIFKNNIVLSVNKGASFIEKLLIEGNEDGSMSVAYPKQVAQVLLVLSNAWLDPDLFQASYQEYEQKVKFMEYFGEVLGVPLVDDELKKIFLKLHKDYK
ncbi:MAG: TetR/AcrR family transcriptional regulator [Treponema sp.]|nr:TetR/AcrR family transcriptional regulator [Treponema sp.]